MTDTTTELVARLRTTYSHRGDGLATQLVNPDGPEAAARIEELEAQVRAMGRALEPFVDLRCQKGAWGVISKDLDDFAPMTVTVTKAQMIAARKALPDPPRSKEEMD